MSTNGTSASSRPETAPDGPPARSRRSPLTPILVFLAAVCLAVAGVVALRDGSPGWTGHAGPAGGSGPPGTSRSDATPGSAGPAAGTSGAPGTDSPAAGAGVPLFAVPAERHVPLGTMRIPRIGLEAPFYPGVYDEVVALGPGLWPGTPLPGAPGNAVFAGHRTTHTHPFGDIDRLAPGDVVETALGSAPPIDFTVVATAVVPEAQYVDFVLRQPADPLERRITLFACDPKGRRTHRIVVEATASPASPGRAAGASDPAEGRDAVRPNAAG